jgi:hypothetical protein
LVWPAVVAAVLAPAAWGRLRPRVFLRADILAMAGGLAITAVGAVLWVVLARANSVLANFVPLPASSSFSHIVSYVVGHFPSLLAQGVGNFGWLDTPVPRFVLAAWALLGAGLVAVAIVRGPKRTVRGPKRTLSSLLVAVLASFFVPVVSLVAVAHSYGYAGQGRYFLAIWAGVPIVAAGLAGLGAARRWARPFTIATGVLVAGGQAVAFYWALRRYIVGIPGPLIWSGGRTSGRLQWHPPVPGWWLLGIFVALCVLYGVAISRPGLTAGAPRTGRKM